jgi:3-phenylpropionate/trans-cinnamate dioxygenase ferredoxin reductase subunit
MADALSLRSALSGNPRVVVVGAGFIGTEIAAVARAGCDEVTVVDVVDRPLPALPPPVSAALRRLHERAGVRFRLGTSVAELHGTAAVESVELSDGEKLPADLVLIGVGLVPGDELARSAGLACDDGILVGDRFETSAPNIYAVGDVARPRSGFLGMSARHEHWRGAHDGGAALGRFLVTGEQPVSVPPWFWTEQFDAVIHAAGEPRPGDELVVRGDPDADAFTVFTRRGGVWTGVVGVDRPLEVRVAQPILGRDWPLEDALASTETDLRRALRAWTSAGA